MSHQQHIIEIKTRPYRLHDVTDQVVRCARASALEVGLCTLMVQHTSASLMIQENADPAVLRDFENFFAKLVPEHGFPYEHTTEGSDDMPAHIRSALTQTSLSIPMAHSRLLLGTWQAIYLWEHRSFAHTRRIVVHLSGDAS